MYLADTSFFDISNYGGGAAAAAAMVPMRNSQACPTTYMSVITP
jgi:hypothetical protein